MSVGKLSGNLVLLHRALSHVTVRPQSIYEVPHVTTMIGVVEAGLGVAAEPSRAMPAADHPLLVSVPLEEPVVTRSVRLISAARPDLAPSAQQLYDFLLEMKPEAQPGRREVRKARRHL